MQRKYKNNPSVSSADSSLCTREAFNERFANVFGKLKFGSLQGLLFCRNSRFTQENVGLAHGAAVLRCIFDIIGPDNRCGRGRFAPHGKRGTAGSRRRQDVAAAWQESGRRVAGSSRHVAGKQPPQAGCGRRGWLRRGAHVREFCGLVRGGMLLKMV